MCSLLSLENVVHFTECEKCGEVCGDGQMWWSLLSVKNLLQFVQCDKISGVC